MPSTFLRYARSRRSQALSSAHPLAHCWLVVSMLSDGGTSMINGSWRTFDLPFEELGDQPVCHRTRRHAARAQLLRSKDEHIRQIAPDQTLHAKNSRISARCRHEVRLDHSPPAISSDSAPVAAVSQSNTPGGKALAAFRSRPVGRRQRTNLSMSSAARGNPQYAHRQSAGG